MSSHTCKGTKKVKWDMEGTHWEGAVPRGGRGLSRCASSRPRRTPRSAHRNPASGLRTQLAPHRSFRGMLGASPEGGGLRKHPKADRPSDESLSPAWGRVHSHGRRSLLPFTLGQVCAAPPTLKEGEERQKKQTKPQAGSQGKGAAGAAGRIAPQGKKPTMESKSCSLEMCHLHAGHSSCKSFHFFLSW